MRILSVSGLAFSLCIAACGGSSSGGSSDSTGAGAGGAGGGGVPTVKGSPVARADFAATYAKAFCSSIAGCCAAKSFPYDGPKCEVYLTGLLGTVYPDDPSQLDYDPVAAGDCIATAASYISTCKDDGGPPPAVCDQMFTGKVPEGGTCKFSGNVCAPVAGADVSCDYDPATKAGKCAVKPVGKAGDGCGSSCTRHPSGDTSCTGFGSAGSGPMPGKAECYSNDGLYCDGSVYQCKPTAKLGEACTSTEGCLVDTFCDAGKCAPPLALGAKCSFSSLCANGYCDNATQACVPKKKDTATCQSSSECQSGECNYMQGGTMGTCRAADSGPASAEVCSGTGF